MNREIAERWIAALRSGQYRQTANRLCRFYIDDEHKEQCSYCAMGLLAELYQQETGELNTIPNKDQPGTISFKDETKNKWSAIFIPTEVVQWAGLKNSAGSFGPSYSVWVDIEDEDGSRVLCTSVVALNDDARLPFADIADIIEQRYEDM